MHKSASKNFFFHLCSNPKSSAVVSPTVTSSPSTSLQTLLIPPLFWVEVSESVWRHLFFSPLFAIISSLRCSSHPVLPSLISIRRPRWLTDGQMLWQVGWGLRHKLDGTAAREAKAATRGRNKVLTPLLTFRRCPSLSHRRRCCSSPPPSLSRPSRCRSSLSPRPRPVCSSPGALRKNEGSVGGEKTAHPWSKITNSCISLSPSLNLQHFNLLRSSERTKSTLLL